MARVTFVKRARKANRVAGVGESYYWWKPFRSGKQFSKNYPRPSMLCSGRKSEVMAAQEALTDNLSGAATVEDIQSACESCAESFHDLGQEYEESADAMPENFQYTDQTEGMREMASSLETQADELDNLDFNLPNDWDEEEPEFNESEPVPETYEDDDDYLSDYSEWEERKSDHEDEVMNWESDKEAAENENESHLETLRDDAESFSGDVEFMF